MLEKNDIFELLKSYGAVSQDLVLEQKADVRIFLLVGLHALIHLRMFDFCTPQFIENKHCTCSLMPRPQLRCQAALQLQRIMRGKLARKKVIYLLKCAEIFGWEGDT